MNLFEKDKFSSRSKMIPIEISNVIEDIKFSSLESDNLRKLAEEGHLSFSRIQDDFRGDLCYYIKPTQEVKDHIINIGYGEISGIGYSDISNTISFHSLW